MCKDNMTKEERFIEASKRERFFFHQFKDNFNLFNDKNYETYITPIEGYDKYDALIQKYEDGEFIPSKRYIMEFKVRNLSHSTLMMCEEDGFILEASKLKSLIEVCKLDPDKNEIYYVNFTNHYTLIWNISLLIKENRLGKPVNKNMNEATMVSTSNKIDKKVFLLKKKDAVLYEYSAIEESYIANESKEKELKRRRRNDIVDVSNTFTRLLENLKKD